MCKCVCVSVSVHVLVGVCFFGLSLVSIGYSDNLAKISLWLFGSVIVHSEATHSPPLS